MSVEPAALAGETAAQPRKPGLSGRLARDGGIIFGAVVILFMMAIGLLAPVLGTKNPTEINPAFRNRVPGMVWLLLLLVAACGAWTSGYGSGLRGHRHAFDLYTFPVLVGVVITIISDIDQPRRGLISVSQDPLRELLESMSP